MSAEATQSPPSRGAVSPANPHASASARALLEYLASPQGAEVRLLSGQHTGSLTGAPESATTAAYGYRHFVEPLAVNGGPLVALVGADYGYSDRRRMPPTDVGAVNAPLLAHWERGGVVTVMFSARNPWTGGNHNDRDRQGHALTDLLSDTEARAAWRAELDVAAAGLQALEDAGVVVLWRPLHEMNGAWFWWGYDPAGTESSDFVQLWRDTFDYLTYEKGLDNLLWVYAVSADGGPATAPETQFYPGDAYVDIVGLDLYVDAITPTELAAHRRLTDLGKPFALTEVGPSKANRSGTFDYAVFVRDVATLMPDTRYFMAWSDFTNSRGTSLLSLVSNQHSTEALARMGIVNVDDLPSFRR